MVSPISVAFSKFFFILLLIIIPSQTVCAYNECYTHRSPCSSCCLDSHGSPKNTTTIRVVEVDKITKALRDSGYKLMAKILERNLRSVQPYCDEFLFFVDRHNRFTIYGNNTVTLFVPPDDSIQFRHWIDLDYQIMVSQVDKEAIESGYLYKGSKLMSCSPVKQRLVVDQVFDNGTVSINRVKIKHWNIYNDGHVIVHGTEGFFNHFLGK